MAAGGNSNGSRSWAVREDIKKGSESEEEGARALPLPSAFQLSPRFCFSMHECLCPYHSTILLRLMHYYSMRFMPVTGGHDRDSDLVRQVLVVLSYLAQFSPGC